MADLSLPRFSNRGYHFPSDRETVESSKTPPLNDYLRRLSLESSSAAEYIPSQGSFRKFLEHAKFPMYFTISARTATFSYWPFKHQSPEKLAIAGFFSAGEDDVVYCFYCGGRLYDWESNVLPWEEHALYFPRCDWLLEQKGNAFVEKIQSKVLSISGEKEEKPSGLNSSKSVINSTFYNKIDMSVLKNRIQSFKGNYHLFLFSVKDLAEAGFFYTGTHKTIQCYLCAIEIYDCTSCFSPLEIHQKKSPTCLMVKGVKEQDKEVESEHYNKRQSTSSERSNEKVGNVPCRNDYVTSIEDHRTEYDRLLSFYHWPICRIVDRFDLAAAGFYWKDKLISITVQCFACFGKVEGWQMGENPQDRHRLLFPSCPFVMGKETGNVKATPEEKRFALRIFSERDSSKRDDGRSYFVSSYRQREKSSLVDSIKLTSESVDDPSYKSAQYPRFYFEMSRLKSFFSWPPHHFASLTTLAAAGFFCNDIEDQVTCFFCGGKLCKWEANDEPWKEHARNFPHCKWLVEQKGKQFVDNVRTTYEAGLSANQGGRLAASTQRKLGRGEVLPVKKENQKKGRTNQTDNDLDNILQSDVVQVLVEMGFHISIIKTVIQKRLDEGEIAYRDTEDLLSAIFAEENSSQTSNDDESKHLASNPINFAQNEPEVPRCQQDIPNSSLSREIEDTQSEIALLSQKLEQLEEKNLCKICLDGEVDVLFLPCKHLVVCKNCSEKLEECPICRSDIDEKVNVFKP